MLTELRRVRVRCPRQGLRPRDGSLIQVAALCFLPPGELRDSFMNCHSVREWHLFLEVHPTLRYGSAPRPVKAVVRAGGQLRRVSRGLIRLCWWAVGVFGEGLLRSNLQEKIKRLDNGSGVWRSFTAAFLF